MGNRGRHGKLLNPNPDAHCDTPEQVEECLNCPLCECAECHAEGTKMGVDSIFGCIDAHKFITYYNEKTSIQHMPHRVGAPKLVIERACQTMNIPSKIEGRPRLTMDFIRSLPPDIRRVFR